MDPILTKKIQTQTQNLSTKNGASHKAL